MRNVSNVQCNEKYVICKQYVSKGAAGQGSEPREGAMDDDYDHDDRIYAV